ncbi:MAG: hypothetical protein WC389_21660 [Lutibacter sp.]|jgi:L-rhamnose mutarotase
MNTKEELEKQLADIINKWESDIPKSDMDKRWWQYLCDKCLTVRLQNQINNYNIYLEDVKKIEAENKIDYDKVDEIFI